MADRTFNIPSDLLTAARNAPTGKHLHPSHRLGADGFDIWWQKTVAQNMAMVTEASDLMRAHRLVSSANQPRARQAH
jgi:hypothetical protein